MYVFVVAVESTPIVIGKPSGEPRPLVKRQAKRPAEDDVSAAAEESKENTSKNSLNSTFFDSPRKKLKFDDVDVTPTQTPTKQGVPVVGTPSILKFFFEIGQKKRGRVELKAKLGMDVTPNATPIKHIRPSMDQIGDWPKERERLSPDSHSILVRAPSSVVKRRLKVIQCLFCPCTSLVLLNYFLRHVPFTAAYPRGDT